MSGELDERPDLAALLRNLRDRVYELEHRVSGDANPLALNDLEDVRVDSLGDATITLADGSALVYRASDGLWVPGAGGVGGTPTDWVEWDIPSDIGPFAWNTSEQPISWTDDITNATHGSAIALVSGDAEVQEDGWYTVYGYVRMQPVTGTAVYDFARLRLRGTSSPQFTIGSDFLDWPDIVTEVRPSSGNSGSVFYHATLPFSWTGYLVAGSPIQLHAQMGAASDPGSDWEVTAGLFNMLRLPL